MTENILSRSVVAYENFRSLLNITKLPLANLSL
jgi:hypothetical protein